MNFEDLQKILPDNYSVIDRELIKNAYQFAEEAHRGQLRASGEPYITHCVAVAYILAELKVPPAVIAAALLHDTVEDTTVTLEDLKEKFSEEIATLVDGVTKLTNLPRVTRGEKPGKEKPETPDEVPDGIVKHAEGDDLILGDMLEKSRRKDLATETLRKTLMAMGDDVRVVMIKLADRLHNMRTLSYIPESKRYRIAKETLDIFAPLANRLGIWQIKWELEDLAFRYTQPEEYKAIAAKLADRRVNRETEVKKITVELEKVLSEGGIKAEITGRSKHIYSIYQKMMQKEKSFENVRDLRGVRLIVQDIPSCYAALGIIHTHWRPIPNEFDDYIAAPKDNFYQSIHTSVIYSDGKPLEVQIRTEDMHQAAEYGIAAHWLYKEKGSQEDRYQQRINWLRKLMEWRQDVDDAEEFVNGVKSDVFEDRVYIFTPRGDIIDLPVGATPIDFAYSVHTEVGNRCRGAKINGKLVSLDYHLKTGDQVEILTAKRGGPSRDWLNTHLGLVNTQRARAKIRQWFKKQDREQNLAQGRDMLDRELKRADRFGSVVSMIFIDMDHFKGVNDTHGHLFGSQVLHEVGQLLKKSVREVDVIIRYGGDEFTIILVETGEKGAATVAERIRRSIEDHHFLASEGLDVRLTASLGYACYPLDPRSKMELLELADKAMYRGKEEGKNRVFRATAIR